MMPVQSTGLFHIAILFEETQDVLSTRTRAALECGKQSGLGLSAKVRCGIFSTCRRA